MGFSLLRVTVNRQRHKAAGQSDDESCVCARWVAATRLFILFLFFFSTFMRVVEKRIGTRMCQS